ncbi:MAG TPA: methylcrotonoyl-CoA carboxylase, partial [Bacteroidetes bacterium]|nr:methylcrotonoyl-CoA carboxylase [Bacteroidota bacterium]
MARTIGSAVAHDLVFESNADANRQTQRVIEGVSAAVRRGGGAKSIERHKAKGKMTARERIDALVDTGSSFLEVGLLTAHGMYEEEGGCPSAGV